MAEGGDRIRTVAVLDIGKTNLKILLATPDGAPVEAVSRPSRILASTSPIRRSISTASSTGSSTRSPAFAAAPHRRVVTTAHGGGAVLADESGPVLPMMDYEAPSPPGIDALYAAEAPPYDEVFCATGARRDAARQAAPVAAAPLPDATSPGHSIT